jgi:ABC-type glycerol-3-phosphate transport system substrate-binding protein
MKRIIAALLVAALVAACSASAPTPTPTLPVCGPNTPVGVWCSWPTPTPADYSATLNHIDKELTTICDLLKAQSNDPYSNINGSC